MRTKTAASTTVASPSQLPAADRRSRARLRDLCDEVLASFRLASTGELFSEQDRTEGRALIGRLVARS